MSLNWITHTMPAELLIEPEEKEEDLDKIGKRQAKISPKLIVKMRVIRRREGESWKMSRI